MSFLKAFFILEDAKINKIVAFSLPDLGKEP